MSDRQRVEESRLPDGTIVVSERLSGLKSVSLGFWVDVGSRDEGDDLQGCSHFLEHLLFKGTKNRSSEEISTVIESRGGRINAFTDRDLTCYTACVLERDMELAVEVIADMVQNPLLSEEDIENERRVVLEEISRRDDDPESLIHDLYVEEVWRGSQSAHSILGNEDSVRGMPAENIRRYFKDHYTPGNITVSAAGAVEHENLVETVENQFQKGQARRPQKRTPPVYKPSVKLVEKKTSQVQLCMVTDGIAYVDDSINAFSIINGYLGIGFSSRLFQEVREKRGLAYSIYTSRYSMRDAGLFGVFAGTRQENVERVIEITLHELEKVKQGMDRDQLDGVKHKTIGVFVLSTESTQSRMYQLGISTLRLGRPRTIREVIEGLEAVTPEDVARIAERVFYRDGVSVIALGLSKEKAEDLRAKIG